MSNRHEWYVLDDNKIARPATMEEWAAWRGSRKTPEGMRLWRVALENTGNGEVSTVFLGLDHAYGDEPPQIFESLVFGGPFDQDIERYSTWAEAEAGHAAIVARLKNYAKSLADNAP